MNNQKKMGENQPVQAPGASGYPPVQPPPYPQQQAPWPGYAAYGYYGWNGRYPTVPAGAPAGPAAPAAAPPSAAAWAPPAAVKKQRQPLTATLADALFAMMCLVLGFLFIRWVVWGGFGGWGVCGFTLVFGAAVLPYARAKGVKPSAESWVWLAILQLCGLAFALWPAGILQGWQGLLWFFCLFYWCATLFGALLRGKTGNLLPFDYLNATCVLPFRNLDSGTKSMAALKSSGKNWRSGLKKLMPVVLGLAAAGVVLAVVLPMLAKADATGFGRVLAGVMRRVDALIIWALFKQNLGLLLLQLLLGVPVAFYLCGLVAGGVHKRYAVNFEVTRLEKAALAVKKVPGATIVVLLGVVSAVYALFIGFQLPYFFSAFGGVLPEGFDLYSQYAREGFFELCRIAAINLGLLALCGGLYRGKMYASKPLRALNILLSALTLLVIGTALSKMWLYIAAYGLTPKRVMTCVFMLFLAGVCVAVVVLQFKKFSIIRFAALFGAGLLCALCLSNMNGWIVAYNAARYEAGTLPGFDELLLYRSGPAGYEAGLRVYEAMDEETRDSKAGLRLYYVLKDQERQAADVAGSPGQDTLAAARVRKLDGALPDDRNREKGGRELFWKRAEIGGGSGAREE